MRKRFIVFMAILVLLLSMVGCGKTEEPVGNDAEPTITEAASNDVVNDVEPTEIPEVEETPVVEEPTVEPTQAPVVEETTEPEVTDAPEVEETTEPEVEVTLEDLRVETLNYAFEGIYWLTDYDAVVYYDGTNECYYYDANFDGLAEESKREYTATENTYEYVGATYGFRWYIYDDTFGFWLDGGEMGGDAGAMETVYTAISKEKAIELYPVIGEDKDETETPSSTPVATDSLESYRVETLNYDFEGIYWLDENGKVRYFDGENETVYYADGSVKVRALSETNDEYFVYADDGFGVIWYINNGTLYFCLGDYSVYNTLTPLTKEQAIEKCPAIGGDVVEDNAPVVEEPVVEPTQAPVVEEPVESDMSFEGSYWYSTSGTSYEYYDGTESRFTADGNVYTGTYTVKRDILTVIRDGYEYQFRYSVSEEEFILEPIYAEGEGGGGMTLVLVKQKADEKPAEETAATIEGKFWIRYSGESVTFYVNDYYDGEKYLHVEPNGTVIVEGYTKTENEILFDTGEYTYSSKYELGSASFSRDDYGEWHSFKEVDADTMYEKFPVLKDFIVDGKIVADIGIYEAE